MRRMEHGTHSDGLTMVFQLIPDNIVLRGYGYDGACKGARVRIESGAAMPDAPLDPPRAPLGSAKGYETRNSGAYDYGADLFSVR